MVSSFNSIDDEKNQASDEYESHLNQLNRKIIELEAKQSNQKQQLSDLTAETEAKDELLVVEQRLREQLQKDLAEAVDSFSMYSPSQ